MLKLCPLMVTGGHLGWRFGSLDIILKVDHLRTIPAMFAINWLIGFRGKKFKHFSHRVMEKMFKSLLL
jgi:hypothetical protein